MSKAIDDVVAEHLRQIEREGYTGAHDDTHSGSRELARAGGCYLQHFIGRQWVFGDNPENYQGEAAPDEWPWELEAWKPKNPRRDLVRAAALIIAQIDQLDRSGALKEGE